MGQKPMAIVNTVKQHRMARGWSQEVLADKIQIRRQAIYDIESGRYLPNTAIALRLARVFGCRVEDLFSERETSENWPVHLLDGQAPPATRLALGRVGDRLVGIPLKGAEAIPFGLRPADGVMASDGKGVRVFTAPGQLEKTIILMGCDPAFEILAQHVCRAAADHRVLCRFASSMRALGGLVEGVAHVAGTHLHNTGKDQANVATASRRLAGLGASMFGFSLMEEGLMVARGNPLGIRGVADLARPGLRFVNREAGAALRVLLDDHLRRAGVEANAIHGYRIEVASHREGAYRIACDVADAALGLRAIADAYGLGFVPIAAARCDLVIPSQMQQHPTVEVLLNVLQSAALRKEIDAIAGYDGSVTGQMIAAF